MIRGADAAVRRWVVCADDYAYDDGACEAIVQLGRSGRLTATSVLAGTPLWERQAPPLLELSDRIDIGLHLNLTEDLGAGTATWPLSQLIARTASGQLDRPAVREALARQLDDFEQHTGCPPDFIDGHQHVHQFRAVREILLAELLVRYPGRHPWIRSTRPAPGAGSAKARFIAALGEASLRRAAVHAGFPMNLAFAGVYDFHPDPQAHEQRVATWLRRAIDGTVMMCHPSSRIRPQDPIGPARAMEFAFLSSPRWLQMLGDAGVRLARGRDILAVE